MSLADLTGPRGMNNSEDRGTTFDGVKVGRPATGALVDAGYESLTDLPDDLDALSKLHGVGPSAIEMLEAARSERADG